MWMVRAGSTPSPPPLPVAMRTTVVTRPLMMAAVPVAAREVELVPPLLVPPQAQCSWTRPRRASLPLRCMPWVARLLVAPTELCQWCRL